MSDSSGTQAFLIWSGLASVPALTVILSQRHTHKAKESYSSRRGQGAGVRGQSSGHVLQVDGGEVDVL